MISKLNIIFSNLQNNHNILCILDETFCFTKNTDYNSQIINLDDTTYDGVIFSIIDRKNTLESLKEEGSANIIYKFVSMNDYDDLHNLKSVIKYNFENFGFIPYFDDYNSTLEIVISIKDINLSKINKKKKKIIMKTKRHLKNKNNNKHKKYEDLEDNDDKVDGDRDDKVDGHKVDDKLDDNKDDDDRDYDDRDDDDRDYDDRDYDDRDYDDKVDGDKVDDDDKVDYKVDGDKVDYKVDGDKVDDDRDDDDKVDSDDDDKVDIDDKVDYKVDDNNKDDDKVDGDKVDDDDRDDDNKDDYKDKLKKKLDIAYLQKLKRTELISIIKKIGLIKYNNKYISSYNKNELINIVSVISK
jgi:hypothetical protein